MSVVQPLKNKAAVQAVDPAQPNSIASIWVDPATGEVRIGANGASGANVGVAICTWLGGALQRAIQIAADGTLTFLKSFGAFTIGDRVAVSCTEDAYVNLGATPQAVSFVAYANGASFEMFLQAANGDTCNFRFFTGVLIGNTEQSAAIAGANCTVTKTSPAGVDTYAIAIPGNARTYYLRMSESNGALTFGADATATGTTKLIALSMAPVF